MKRKVSLIVLVVLALSVCFGVLVACQGLDDYAITELTKKVEEQISNAQGKTSYVLSDVVSFEDVDGNEISCNIKWEADNGVTITNGSVTVPSGVTSYILTAKLVDEKGNEIKTVSKAVSVNGGNQGGNQGGNEGGNQGGDTQKTSLEQIKENAVSAPAAGTDYVMVMWQGSANKVLYATGVMDGKFLATTESKDQAATVTIETTTGGFYIALTAKGGSKQYITLVDDTNGATNTKTKITLTASGSTVYSVANDNILMGAFDNGKFMLSTHGTYETISSNSDHYLNDSKGEYAVDISQFVARLIPANVTIGSGGNQGGNQGGTETPAPDGTLIGTISLEKVAPTSNNGTEQKTYTLNGLTVINDKAESTDTMNIADPVSARFYRGSTMTFQSTQAFKKIVINADDYSSGKYTTGFNGMTVTGATITVNGATTTIVLDAASTSFISGNLLSQMRIKSIDFYA